MSGHIRRRGEHTWELKFDLGTDPITGRRQTRYCNVKGTKREAQAELTRLLSQANDGVYIDPSKTTVAEFLDRWERDWAAPNVSPKTLERYVELLRVHVRPHLGALRIQKLQTAHLAELYAKLQRDAGLAARTVGHVHRVLHKALQVAAEWNVVQRNVSSAARPPKVQTEEIEILTEPQIRDLLHRLRGRTLYLIALLGLATGMRRGELLALRWRDVDLDAGKIRVEQSVEQTKSGLRFKSPKTKHGRRTISLPASAVLELRSHWKHQQELRLRLGLGKASADALVLANTANGTCRSPNATTREWVRAMSALGLPQIGLHALRHTHASQLIASGMDVLTISRRLGHGSPTITLGVYAHLFHNTDDRAAQIMESALGRVVTD